MNKAILYILLSALFSANLLAQNKEDAFIQSDTLEVVKSTQIIGLPILFYTPETSFGFGGGIQFLFRDMRNVFNSRLSDMMVTAVYTAKNQLLIDARPQIHIYDGQFYLEGIIRYKLFPNSFWGIGNQAPDADIEAYNMKSTEIHALLLKRIPHTVNFGFEYIYQRHEMLEYEDDGQLIHQAIPGSEGAIISSLFSVFTYDNRDNIFSTTQGNYLKLKAGFCSRVLGGSHSYNKYIFDLRKYIPFSSKLSFAGQYFTEMNHGNIPFQSMAWFGGGERARGYFRGRYIDKQIYVAQAELRWRFAKRWIIAGFASGGNVAENVSGLFEYMQYSYGGGIRFQISKKSPTLVRLDLGIGKPGNSGVYFGVNEAF